MGQEVETIYLDTETTGLKPGYDEILEIAIVDDDGKPLLNTLVKPEHRKRWPKAQSIHGISPAMLADAPTLQSLMPKINDIVRGKNVVIYNADYDLHFFQNKLRPAASRWCAMQSYANFRKIPHPRRRGEYKWFKLAEAASECGHVWAGDAHRALADALACRTVWQWMLWAKENCKKQSMLQKIKKMFVK